ncbi:MAG: phosphatase PAP2 family protein [Chloroflexi bacterium]|nr:phosphatase PAP2 family protein [Chloroflexota bacterium]
MGRFIDGLPLAWRVSAACMIIFLLVAVGVTRISTIQHIDRDASEAVYRALPMSWCEFITWWGHNGLYLLGGAIAAVLIWKRQWTLAVFATSAVSGGIFLQSIIKPLVARPRPLYPDADLAVHSYSFPSGHTLLSLIVYGVLVYLIMRRVQDRRTRLLIVSIAALWVALIGLSRVVLGFHHLGDILGSLTLGIAWLATCIGLLDYLNPSHQSKPHPYPG